MHVPYCIRERPWIRSNANLSGVRGSSIAANLENPGVGALGFSLFGAPVIGWLVRQEYSLSRGGSLTKYEYITLDCDARQSSSP